MRYARDTKSLSDIMEKELKLLDKDHIHYMIETEPTMSVSKIVNLMKSYTTYYVWERYLNYLRKHFWKEHTFWTDGYFAKFGYIGVGYMNTDPAYWVQMFTD